MRDETKKKLKVTTIVYWILLFYIIAALVWWAILLIQQTEEVYQLKIENLKAIFPESSAQFKTELYKIADQKKRDIYKYLGEGITFLLLILIGAVYVYRSVRRQFKQQQQQQHFVMAVTHELKTPIAVSKLNLETLLKYKLDEVKKEKLLQMTVKEIMRLDNLINNILLSSQLEGNTYSLIKEEIDLSELSKKTLQQFSSRYPERKTITEIDDDVIISGDAVLLKLLISNILENAHKYSSTDKPILLQLTKSNKIELIIVDEGIGIPDEEKENVYKKFYRIGNEQTRKTKGTGLGLYLSKKIVEDHNGTITVKDHSPNGSKFIIQFPI
ncbi:MAG TPA: ATP-binding protein [Flavisolibacter sp.]|nr:ATP-binding protein [Flavisolibacter sp.]